MVTYNRARTLGRAIASVLVQDYPDLRLIIVDDGSTDETGEVLAGVAHDARVRVLRHPRNRGVAAARNTGLAIAVLEADFFEFVDSDDILVRGATRKLVEAVLRSGQALSVTCGWGQRLDSDVLTGAVGRRSGPVTYDDLLSGRLSGDFHFLARSELVNGYRLEERAAGGEGALWLALVRQAPGWLLPDVVLRVDTSGSDRLSRARYDEKSARGSMWACRAGLAAIADDLRSRYPHRYGELAADLAKWAALAGDSRTARAASREALRYDPGVRSLMMILVGLAPPALLRDLARVRSATSSRAKPSNR